MPDIAFAVGVLSRFMYCPERNHTRAAKRVKRYLRVTTRLGVVYGGSEPLQGFADADWAGVVDGHRSKTGFVFTLNGGPITSASKRESTVATFGQTVGMREVPCDQHSQSMAADLIIVTHALYE